MNTPLINTNQPMSMQQQKPIDIKLTGEVKCEICGCGAFQDAIILRSVSAILSGTGKAGFMPIQILVCSENGHINQQLLPKELQTPKITS